MTEFEKALAEAIARPAARLARPKAVPAGQRIRAGKKTHKAKPKIGRGEYIKAPLLRDKVMQPRWAANAAVNNPGNIAAAGAIGTGGGILIGEKKVSKADKKQVTAGALIGGGAGHVARVGADYGAKATGEKQFKRVSAKGNYGPYHEGPHKPTMNKFKREANKAGGVREKAKYFDEHFPKGVPSHNARKLGVALNKKPAVAGAVLGTAAVGAGIGALSGRKVKKNMVLVTKKKQDTGTKEIAAGGGVAAVSAAQAPVLRSGHKDKSKMSGASPKLQGGRYQAELHQAMQHGYVDTDSPVRVLRTPSGRHINVGGTHRHIAREAMGKPSNYEVKDIRHELRASPVQLLQGKKRVRSLRRGSERAEAGKKIRPVGNLARKANKVLAQAADAGDAHVWHQANQVASQAHLAGRVGRVQAGVLVGAGAALAGKGLADRKKWKKSQVKKNDGLSAFGVNHV